MVTAILQAIVWLIPQLGLIDAQLYAHEVADAAACFRIDPLDVLAVIKTESGFDASKQSRTRDYGLMQLHVSRSTRPEYRGLEHLLLEPERNIWLGVRMLAYWRRHHSRHCKGDEHLYVAHYKWGNHVPPGWRSVRFRRVYRRLVKRFRRLIS